MLGIILLSLLGIGATAALAFNLFDDDNGSSRNSDTSNEETDRHDDTNPDDLISGTAADEPISAGPGDDIVRAGDGNDTVEAGSGNDRVFGEAGDDLLAGNSGDDFLRGGAGNDVLVDSDGADTLRGDTGDDLLISTGVTDPSALLASFGAQADDPYGDISIDELAGFDLTLDLDTEGDQVNGGAGQDAIIFGQDDTVTGGEGADLFIGGTTLVAGEPAVITDFEVNEELLVLTYNGGEPPTVGVADEGGDAVLTLDGLPAVILPGLGGSFQLGDVELVDIST